jgi:multicomponent Na+:H+ antiporter subunit D
MSDVLLALLVTIPLTLAVFPLLLGLQFKNVGWPIALAGSLAVTGMSSLLAWDIYHADTATGQRLVHELAGYPGPYGIELVGDGLSALVTLLIGVVSVAVLIYGRTTGPQTNAFYSGFLLLMGGLLGMALTGDLFNLFVFLEIVGLITYALVASGDGGMAAYGALKYLFLGTVGASLYLIGVGYTLVATGTLNMLDLQSTLAGSYTEPLVQAAFGFMLVGLLLKIAVFPLHTWQPDAYTYAPDTVSAYISALVSTTAAYALIRISYDVFTVDFFVANPLISEGIVILASISIVVGSLLAAIQSEIKRVFAYSSVAQFGMIVVAIGLNSETALFGAVIHLVGHGLMKATLFMGAGILSTAYGATTISEYAGLAKRAPLTGGAMAVTGLALVGIPPSIGILGKWYIGLGAVEEGSWGVAIVIFISTLLTLSYVAQIIEKLYFNAPREAEPETATESEAVEQAALSDSPVADGGQAERPVAVERLAVVAILAISTVVLFASVDLFATMIDPVLGRFFA